MATINLSPIVSIAGLNISGTISRTVDGQIGEDPALPAGALGSLTTRTDNDTGVITCSAGHGIVTGKVTLFWTLLGVNYSRVNMDAVVTDNAVAIDAGGGDNLPAGASAIYVGNSVNVDMDFVSSLVKVAAACCEQNCVIGFYTSGNALLLRLTLPANEPWTYVSPAADPFAGTVAYAIVGNGGVLAATARIGIGYDSSS